MVRFCQKRSNFEKNKEIGSRVREAKHTENDSSLKLKRFWKKRTTTGY